MRINYPKIWGQGSLFASSGLETNTTHTNSLVGTLLGDRIGVEFKTELRPSLSFKLFDVKDIVYSIITSDLIKAVVITKEKKAFQFVMTFYSENTVSIKACTNMKASIDFYKDAEMSVQDNGVIVYEGENEKYAIYQEEADGVVRMAFSYGKDADKDVIEAAKYDIDGDVEKKMSFYSQVPRPEFKDRDEEMLYYKCFSIMKSMVYSPEGRYNCFWTTPDRFPHKDCWLWDTAFHVVGLKYIDMKLAEDAVRAVLLAQHEDGYIPHQFSVDQDSHVTQPPVLSWAVYELYKTSKDTTLAEELFDKLAAYLKWDMNNRDDNKNGLLEWLLEDDINCRCGESGMDNTPRFDGEDKMDSIDFNAFFANDARCLSKLAGAIGRKEDEAYWGNVYKEMKEKINKYLWDEKEHFYFDRRLDGTFSSCKSVASFLPLLAGVCDEEQAKYLVDHLDNPDEFGTEFPIATVSKDHRTYASMDMFRGTVWLNFNYLIAKGLEDYGYTDKANEIREKTIEMIKKWYLSDGVIYEFYDSRDKVAPRRLSRKGIALQPYLPDLRYQCVRDFSWGTCFVPDMIIKRKSH